MMYRRREVRENFQRTYDIITVSRLEFECSRQWRKISKNDAYRRLRFSILTDADEPLIT
uniref:Transposase n=1 Tax=Ascaris lumbricoides TaxID=6252 RepID=A0A0M3IRL0_ASCLU